MEKVSPTNDKDASEPASEDVVRSEKPSSGLGYFLLFRVEKVLLAVDVQNVKEVIEAKSVHTIPGKAESSLTGLVNYRGKLQLCFSLLAILMPKHPKSLRDPFRMLAMLWNSEIWIFPVEEVYQAVAISLEAIAAPEEELSRFSGKYVKGVFEHEGEQVLLLKEDSILEALQKECASDNGREQ
ncbi:MAG: chemotaxis protein CheW [Chlamydiota bacterium]